MRFDYIDPFVESASEILSRVLQAPVQRGELSLKDSPVASRGVAAMIGITGDVEGEVIFNMDLKTARQLAEALNGHMIDGLTPLALDTITELANMMIGGAVTALNNQGFEFTVMPPVHLTDIELKSRDTHIETLVIPLSTQYGDVAVHVALRID